MQRRVKLRWYDFCFRDIPCYTITTRKNNKKITIWGEYFLFCVYGARSYNYLLVRAIAFTLINKFITFFVLLHIFISAYIHISILILHETNLKNHIHII